MHSTLPARSVPGNSLTVACVRAGTFYGPEYVSRLQAAVARNLTVPHNFVCLTDRPGEVECQTLPIPMDLPGWWGKVALFSKEIIPGRILFFDLDTVIVGNIDDFAKYDGNLAVINPFQPRAGIASAVMNIGPDGRGDVWEKFSLNPDSAIQFCKTNAVPNWNSGDQRWLELNLFEYDYWQTLLPGRLFSYKYHCQTNLPINASIVCFHGTPRPHEATHTWLTKHWATSY